MNSKVQIQEYVNSYLDVFKRMVGECFNKDYKIPLTEQQLLELCEEMIQSFEKGITFLDLIFVNDEVKGFICYQVDTPESDWCEKESWRCIRELFIYCDVRGKGYGKELAVYAENKLWRLSVPNIYLTADDAIDFWLKIGYHDTGDICIKNEGNILTK